MLSFLSEKKKEAILQYPFMKEYVQARMHKKIFFVQHRHNKAREKFLSALEGFVDELKQRGFSDEEIDALRELGHEDKSKIHAGAAILHVHNFKTKKHPRLARLLIHHASDLQMMEEHEKIQLDGLLESLSSLETLIDDNNWNMIAELAGLAKEKTHTFFDNFLKAGLTKNFDINEQRSIFEKALGFITHAGLHAEKNVNVVPSVFVSYALKQKKNGRPISEIPVKEYYSYIQSLRKKKVLGDFHRGDLVTLEYEQNKIVYSVVKETPEGYMIKKVGEEKLSEVKGPYTAYQLRAFTESDDWTNVAKLQEKGFLVVHATNAYTKRDSIEGLKQNIKKQGGYSISCSTVHPDYASSVAISDEIVKHEGVTHIAPHAIGIVLSAGKIYAAYMKDADTYQAHNQYKTGSSDEPKVSVRMAVTTKHEFNELLLQDWKVGGLFYTTETPEFRKALINHIAAEHGLKIYVIDENTNKWKEIGAEDLKDQKTVSAAA